MAKDGDAKRREAAQKLTVRVVTAVQDELGDRSPDELPMLGPALVAAGMAFAASAGESKSAFDIAVKAAVRAGVVRSPEKMLQDIKANPQAFADLLGEVFGADRVEIVEVREQEQEKKRRFPWLR